jgi:hypothetical protein
MIRKAGGPAPHEPALRQGSRNGTPEFSLVESQLASADLH